jgi:uncharacterized protein (DUF1778 family)
MNTKKPKGRRAKYSVQSYIMMKVELAEKRLLMRLAHECDQSLTEWVMEAARRKAAIQLERCENSATHYALMEAARCKGKGVTHENTNRT